MNNFLEKAKKPIVFMIAAALGCFVAALFAEPLFIKRFVRVRLQATQKSGWDDIGQMIDELGLPRTFFDGKIEGSIFFLNCLSSDCSRINPDELRTFVENGGVVYGSDHAKENIEAAFPGLITFRGNPHHGSVAATVLDKELKNITGENISIYYDTVTYSVQSISKGEIVLQTRECPIMVICPYGKGKVFYTSFHNHKQTNEKETALLKLLILKQIGNFSNTSLQAIGNELNINLEKYKEIFAGNTNSATVLTSSQHAKMNKDTGEIVIPRATSGSWAIIQAAVWSILLCFGMCVCIVAVQNRIMRKPTLEREQAIVLIVGAVVGGTLAGLIGDAAFRIVRLEFVGRVVGWGLLGAALAYGMSFYIANLDRKKALIGGTFGGLLGVIGFYIFSVVGNTGGRLIGAAILGACIGLMIGLVELISRNVWLMVLYDPRDFTQVNLGRDLVTIGSGKHDTVFVADAAPRAAEFQAEGDKIRFTDAGGTQYLAPGSRVQVGKIELVICSNDVPFSPSKFYPMKMSKAKELQKQNR